MIKKLLESIKNFDIITIYGHIRPDGDCIGSQFGLKNIITENFKKEVHVIGDNSDRVGFLGKVEKISDEKIEKSLAIVVDTATLDRASDKSFLKAKEVIRIDHHHVGSENYGKINIVEAVSSCCEIIAYIALNNGLIINKDAATALYTGMVLDTGGFRYRGVSEQTLACAAKLISFGADPTNIDNIISCETLNKVELKGYVINNMKKTEGGFLYCYMPKKIVAKYDVSREEASDTLSVMSNIKGFPVWALLVEDDDEIRIRLRSSGPRIDYLANKYGGGGHALASGAKLSSLDQLKAFCNDVDEVIKNF